MIRKTLFPLVLMGMLILASAASAADLNLAVAASLKDAINELAAVYAKKAPSVGFRKNFGASGALAKQVENGAPADIFIAANTEWVEYLKGKKLLDDASIGIFAYNELVFAGKPGLKVRSLREVTTLGRIAIGSPKSVPAGEYATTAFHRAGIEKQLAGKLVMAKDVRECLMYANRGEVDGSFVYKTDAEQAGNNVTIYFAVPQEYYPRVTYPIALTASGKGKAEAVAFYRFLLSPEAKAILARQGFPVR